MEVQQEIERAPRRVKSLDRALDVLECVAAADRRGLTLAEVNTALGGSKGNLYSILQTWLDRGFLRNAGRGHSRRYSIGPRLLSIADNVSSNPSLTEAVVPILQQLTDETGLTSRMAVLDNGYAVALSRVDAPGSIQFAPYLGRREYPHCSAVGKALLASLDRKKISEIITAIGLPRRTQRTITNLPDFLAELDRVSAQGFATDDEEDTEGVICVGAAFHDSSGAIAGAISISGLKLGASAGWIRELGKTVQHYAQQISSALSG